MLTYSERIPALTEMDWLQVNSFPVELAHLSIEHVNPTQCPCSIEYLLWNDGSFQKAKVNLLLPWNRKIFLHTKIMITL